MTPLRDWHTPAPAQPSHIDSLGRGEMRGAWSPAALEILLSALGAAGAQDPRPLLQPSVVWDSWRRAVDEVLSDRDLHQAVARSARLSTAGARAALAAVLGEGGGDEGRDLLEQGWRLPQIESPLLAILPATVPGIAAQVVLPTIARGRPLCLKSARDEPWSTPALLGALTRRLPTLAPLLAAVVWPGGDDGLERLAAARVGAVLAYGSDLALDHWRSRDAGVVGLGPRASCAVLDAEAIDETVVAGLVRDTVLLEQRGCLSLAGVVLIGDEAAARALADQLARGLAVASHDLPPGPASAAELAAVQGWRLAARAAGCAVVEAGPIEAGAIVVDPEGDALATPGLRNLTLVPVGHPSSAVALLSRSPNKLQGVALGGAKAELLRSCLSTLGATWICAPGSLQRPSAWWANAATSPLELVAAHR